MIRVLAIDDEPLALRQLATYIQKIPYFELVAQCQSALQARDVLQREPVDAIFCDINMPDLNGMDFVRQLVNPPMVVFTTAYSEYAVEGYKVDAVDYLLKPFGMDDFEKASSRLRERYALLHPQVPPVVGEDTLFVKADHRMVAVPVQQIIYVQGMAEYLRIYVDGQPKPIITLLAMKRMEERLPVSSFMRIHRSYIVRLSSICEVGKGQVTLTDGKTLPVGDNYRDQLNRWLDARMLMK